MVLTIPHPLLPVPSIRLVMLQGVFISSFAAVLCSFAPDLVGTSFDILTLLIPADPLPHLRPPHTFVPSLGIFTLSPSLLRATTMSSSHRWRI